jgi:polysaccharide chain length determinant protein (PEP-CTERM system associated)
MDDRVDVVRKNIAIKPIHSDIAQTRGLPGFIISFTAGDAHTAQLVCGEITSLFVSENLRSRAASAEGTTEFLKGQLADAKRTLDDEDAKLADFQRKYIGKLPGEGAPNVNMLTSLNTQLEAATQQLSRMEQDKSYMEAILTQQLQNPTVPVITGTGTGAAATVAQSPQMELQALEAQEASLASHYTDDYPDVIAIRRQIAAKKKEIAAAASTAGSAAGTTAAPAKRESLGVQQLRAQIHAVELGIAAKKQEQDQIQANVRLYQDRIQSSPMVEEEYKQLTRDHQTAQTFYDTLLTKMNQSKMATDLEKRQQGEQFRIMDEPNLPDSPTYPKKEVFVGGGLALGLVLGLLVVALLEYRNTAVRTERDIYAFTRLPTLAVIAYSGEVQVASARRQEIPTWRARVAKRLRRKKGKDVLTPVGS